jgi:hypothetical protein
MVVAQRGEVLMADRLSHFAHSRDELGHRLFGLVVARGVVGALALSLEGDPLFTQGCPLRLKPWEVMLS